MKKLWPLLLVAGSCFGAVPTFQSFNSNYFNVVSNTIAPNTNGLVTTSNQLVIVAGANVTIVTNNRVRTITGVVALTDATNAAHGVFEAVSAFQTNAITGGFSNTPQAGPYFVGGTNITVGDDNVNSNINSIVIGYNLLSQKDDTVLLGPQPASAFQLSKNGTALYTNLSAFGTTNLFYGGLFAQTLVTPTLKATTVTATNGLYLPTNAIADWPTAPRTRGEAYFGNSNGWVYVLASDPLASPAWTATNLIARPTP